MYAGKVELRWRKCNLINRYVSQELIAARSQGRDRLPCDTPLLVTVFFSSCCDFLCCVYSSINPVESIYCCWRKDLVEYITFQRCLCSLCKNIYCACITNPLAFLHCILQLMVLLLKGAYNPDCKRPTIRVSVDIPGRVITGLASAL